MHHATAARCRIPNGFARGRRSGKIGAEHWEQVECPAHELDTDQQETSATAEEAVQEDGGRDEVEEEPAAEDKSGTGGRPAARLQIGSAAQSKRVGEDREGSQDRKRLRRHDSVCDASENEGELLARLVDAVQQQQQRQQQQKQQQQKPRRPRASFPVSPVPPADAAVHVKDDKSTATGLMADPARTDFKHFMEEHQLSQYTEVLRTEIEIAYVSDLLAMDETDVNDCIKKAKMKTVSARRFRREIGRLKECPTLLRSA